MRLSSKRTRNATDLELSTTSMIDVVFLLLIFFIVTATFVKPEREYRPSIKVNEKTASVNQKDLEPAIVDIIRQGKGYIYRLGGLEIAEDEALLLTLKAFSNKEDGAFVRAPDNAPFDMTARAIAACSEAGFPAVSYIPMEKSEE